MAAFTRETQVGTSAEIVDVCRLDTTACIVHLDPRGNLGSRGYDFIVIYLVSVRDGVLIPEWQAHLVDSFEALE